MRFINSDLRQFGLLTGLFILALSTLIILQPSRTKADSLPVVHVNGNLTSSQIWDSGKVYIIDSTVTVPDSITLTINGVLL